MGAGSVDAWRSGWSWRDRCRRDGAEKQEAGESRGDAEGDDCAQAEANGRCVGEDAGVGAHRGRRWATRRGSDTR